MPKLSRLFDHVKDAAKQGLLATHLPRHLSALRHTPCVILAYHSIHSASSIHLSAYGAGIQHDPVLFEKHVRYVSEHCSPVTLDDVAAALGGGTRLPTRAVAFTFDDGFADNAEIAAPILERYGCRGVFYLLSGCIEERLSPFFIRLRYSIFRTKRSSWVDPTTGLTWRLTDDGDRYGAFIACIRRCSTMRRQEQRQFVAAVEEDLGVWHDREHGCSCMTWEQIQALSERGHLIGAHSVSHPNLAQIPCGAAEREIHDSREMIVAMAHCEVRHFSYPNPTYIPNASPNLAGLVRREGFVTAVTSEKGVVTRGDDAYLLKRVHPLGNYQEFTWRVEAAFGLGYIV